MKRATELLAGHDPNDPYAATSPPIYQTATFRQESPTEFGAYDYSRSGNPTRTLVERQLAALEGGTTALAFSSGMAALATLARTLRPGDEIVAGDDLYGGTFRLLGRVLPERGIVPRFVDASDPESVAAALTPRTRLVLVESPTNPRLAVADLRALARLARGAGALLAVDNSLMTPLLQRPLELGADVVIHSATKGLGGHGDVSAGALVVRDPELASRLSFLRNAEGNALAPFEAWLLLRGMRTLDLRVRRSEENARKLSAFLAAHPRVEHVFHPSLAGHPGRDVHRGQADGDGPVVSFTTGDPELSERIVAACRVFSIAVSFGCVHSAISLPGRMSHASTPPEIAAKRPIPPDLVRLSAGIEDVEDLIADLRAGLGEAATHLSLGEKSARSAG